MMYLAPYLLTIFVLASIILISLVTRRCHDIMVKIETLGLLVFLIVHEGLSLILVVGVYKYQIPMLFNLFIPYPAASVLRIWNYPSQFEKLSNQKNLFSFCNLSGCLIQLQALFYFCYKCIICLTLILELFHDRFH